MISYFYNFNNFSYIKKDENYIIYFKNSIYYLFLVSDDNLLLSQYELSYKYNSSNYIFKFYEFIINIHDNIFTIINNKKYVLLKYIYNKNIDYINLFNYTLDYYIIIRWKEYWITRFDYIIDNFNNYINSCPFIIDYYDYYVGLLNCAICYFDESVKDKKAFLSFNSYNSFTELANPLNIKIDCIERSIGEYIKSLIISHSDLNTIFYIIDRFKFICNFNLVIARIIYPNYFFDSLDLFIINQCSKEKILSYIKGIKTYEFYLSNIINYVSDFCCIKKISFL